MSIEYNQMHCDFIIFIIIIIIIIIITKIFTIPLSLEYKILLYYYSPKLIIIIISVKEMVITLIYQCSSINAQFYSLNELLLLKSYLFFIFYFLPKKKKPLVGNGLSQINK